MDIVHKKNSFSICMLALRSGVKTKSKQTTSFLVTSIFSADHHCVMEIVLWKDCKFSRVCDSCRSGILCLSCL